MARVYFSDKDREEYFKNLKRLSGLSWFSLAEELGISDRHLRDCRKGVYSISTSISDSIFEKYSLALPKHASIKSDMWYISKAGKLGGKRHFELYGPPPATKASRRKGGFNSRRINILRNTGFIVAKNILRAPKNTNLAELIGAFMGDGSLTLTQAHITLNIKTDKEYSIYLRNLVERLFKINVSLYERPDRSTVDVVVSSVNLISFLKRRGLPIGDKIRQGLDIPEWIYKRKEWQRACLRGLLDTDGCTYIDHHKYKDKIYGHIGLAFTSYSSKLIVSIANILHNLGYSPTVSTRMRVLLRKEKEVLRFFKEFRPSNPRHYGKLREFLEGYRSGYNGFASKAIIREIGS